MPSENPVPARAVGMGGAWAALMDEYDLIGENPAGLALSTGKGWTIVGTRSGLSNASLDIGRYGYDLYKKSGLAVDLSTLAKLDLAKIRDKKFTAEGLARTGYRRPGFGYEVLGRVVAVGDPTLDVLGIPEVSYTLTGDWVLGVGAGRAVSLGPGGKLGGGAFLKFVERGYIDEKRHFLEFKGLDAGQIGQNSGLGASLDLGLVYEFRPRYRLGFAVQDVGGTGLHWRRGSPYEPGGTSTILPDARAGFAWAPVLGENFALRVAGDLSGLNRGDENFFKKTHFGAEAEFAKRLFVRGGFNQGYPAAGLDFRWPFLRVSYFFSGEERGRYPGQMGTFKHSLELNFVATVIRRMLRKKVGRVAGRIADAGTGEALPGMVMLADSALGPMAEAVEPFGEYTISLPSERVHRLKAMAEGYEPEVKEVEIATGGTQALDFDLNRKHYPRGDVVGRITDARDGRPIGGFVSAAAGDTGLGQAEADSTTGIYHLVLPPGTYALTARSPGYRELALPGAVQDGEVTTLDFGLAALPRVGEHIILRGIGFRTGSARILEESFPVLDEAARIFIENPTLVAEVGGHTDSRGSARRNQGLSERRAYSVREYLMEKFQLAPERLVARGYGMEKPVDTNATTEGRKANRRIEFVILSR